MNGKGEGVWTSERKQYGGMVLVVWVEFGLKRSVV